MAMGFANFDYPPFWLTHLAFPVMKKSCIHRIHHIVSVYPFREDRCKINRSAWNFRNLPLYPQTIFTDLRFKVFQWSSSRVASQTSRELSIVTFWKISVLRLRNSTFFPSSSLLRIITVTSKRDKKFDLELYRGTLELADCAVGNCLKNSFTVTFYAKDYHEG